jgi:hypothetical protein
LGNELDIGEVSWPITGKGNPASKPSFHLPRVPTRGQGNAHLDNFDIRRPVPKQAQAVQGC